MKNTLKLTAALMLTTTAATAGGIERGGNNYSVLFEEGNYVALSFSSVRPDVSGDYPATLGGGSTDNMSEDYTNLGVALKYELNEQFDVGLFLNQPYGANADYTAGAYTGLGADWDSNQVALVLKYQATPNISVYGGVRSVESEANIAIPDALVRGGLAAAAAAGNAQAGALAAGAPAGTLGYTAETDANRETSYIVGAAYERPEIALRVALTYETGYTHTFAGTESVPAVPTVSGTSDFEIEMPQSVTLDFQSGVAADTLVFGSIRWAEWSVWEVRPNGYEALTGGGRVTGIDDDVTTLRLGVGRKINDDLSVFARVTYEDGNGGEASRLSPTDGSTAFGFGGSYTYNNVKFTGGLEYVKLGDATDASGVEFADNSAIAVGLTVGYQF
ncbi:outer membrane protein transport protein [Loktanella sp. F6476L]|uniref:OmpP1/FadL family transporter n=1 Tax=Loktanella sp. F6476L TaxID=2926405 RepID=UPI001FF417CC|nr:outer membrane protein transport protein [Loktanella sp. F6476L]MCK0119880.1 outer membrane protein transport protein [Loktanella sp. F6476L]